MFKYAATFLTIAALSGCGYDGSYRYPCQDSVNWDKPECQHPACEATDNCTDYLVGGANGS